MNDSADELTDDRPALGPITDSPWFWFALFSAVGFCALIATGGRLGRRQSDIERKYQARTAIASGLEVSAPENEDSPDAVTVPKYSTPQKTVIPLWPLEVILALIGAGSFYMLLRQRFGSRSP